MLLARALGEGGEGKTPTSEYAEQVIVHHLVIGEQTSVRAIERLHVVARAVARLHERSIGEMRWRVQVPDQLVSSAASHLRVLRAAVLARVALILRKGAVTVEPRVYDVQSAVEQAHGSPVRIRGQLLVRVVREAEVVLRACPVPGRCAHYACA